MITWWTIAAILITASILLGRDNSADVVPAPRSFHQIGSVLELAPNESGWFELSIMNTGSRPNPATVSIYTCKGMTTQRAVIPGKRQKTIRIQADTPCREYIDIDAQHWRTFEASDDVLYASFTTVVAERPRDITVVMTANEVVENQVREVANRGEFSRTPRAQLQERIREGLGILHNMSSTPGEFLTCRTPPAAGFWLDVMAGGRMTRISCGGGYSVTVAPSSVTPYLAKRGNEWVSFRADKLTGNAKFYTFRPVPGRTSTYDVDSSINYEHRE